MKKININTFFVVIIVLLAIFNQPLKLTYYGEFLTIISIIYIICYSILKKKIPKSIFKILILCIAFSAIGILGNITSEVERTAYIIILDIFASTKVFICFCAAILYFSEMKEENRLETLKILGNIAKIIVIIAFILYIINMIFDIGLSADYRYGIPSYKFCYNTAAWLSQYWIGIVLILTANLAIRNKKEMIKYIIIALPIWASTLRTRAFAMIAFYVYIYFTLRKKRDSNNNIKQVFKLGNIIPIIILLAFISYDQIEKYFLNSQATARSLLLTTGFQIMNDYFPFGAGFGTFGTEVSSVFYSPLYYKYNLNSFWALNVGGSEFTDNYWPAIAAETGIIGLIITIFILIIIFKECIKLTKGSKYLLMSVILEIMYLILSSTATGIFFSDLTASYMIIIGLICSCGDIYKERMEEKNENNSLI